MRVTDVFIVGGGPAGFSAAVEAHNNSKVRSYDWHETGRFLQNIEDVYPNDKKVLLKGWDPTFDIELGVPFSMENMSKKDFLAAWRGFVKDNKIRLKEASQIDSIKSQADMFVISTKDECWLTRHVVIAAGRISKPNKLTVPGEDLDNVHYNLRRSDKFTKRRVLVVGGGDTAIEVALKLAENNNQVRLSYRRLEFQTDRLHPANLRLIEQAIAKEDIIVHFNSQVKEIFDNIVVLTPTEESDPDWKIENYYENDEVFVCVGSQKPAMNILQGMTLALNKKGLPVIMNGCCTTSVSGIYVIGDLRQDPIYKRGSISKSVWEGQMIIREIFH